MREPVLEVPKARSEGATRGTWTIIDPIEKLKTKYDEESSEFNSIEFDRYIFVRSRDEGWPNRLEGADLAVTRLMNSGVTSEDISSILARRARIEEALRQVSMRASIDDDREPDWEACRAVMGAMECHNVGLAKITKLLCQKRPNLFPMLDSYVMAFLFEDDRSPDDSYADAGIAGMKKFRALMRHGDNGRALEDVVKVINVWLAKRDGLPTRVTGVRALESLLWFDKGGYRAFGWKKPNGRVRRA